jgi:hypothetical protein
MFQHCEYPFLVQLHVLDTACSVLISCEVPCSARFLSSQLTVSIRDVKWRPLGGQSLKPTSLPSDRVEWDLISTDVYTPPGSQFVLPRHRIQRVAPWQMRAVLFSWTQLTYWTVNGTHLSLICPETFTNYARRYEVKVSITEAIKLGIRSR